VGEVTVLPGVIVVPPERVFWRLRRRDGTEFIADQIEYDRLRNLKVRKFVEASPARLHRCSVCSCVGPWTEHWCWFGSYQQLDDHQPIQKFCSEPCRNTSKETGDTETDDQE